MGNLQNRKRKRVRKPPSKMAKKFKHGDEPRDKEAGPSGAKIGAHTANFGVNSENIDTIREGTVFMGLSILFGVFNKILKCPDCGDEMKSHVDMRKKHGYAHYISLHCVAYDWKYCFNTSKKQGQSYEINVRAVLAFREIGKGHSAMTTFSKVLNMPTPPRRANFTKIQNKKLLPVVKQCASDSMVNNAMHVKEIIENDAGECGISIDGTWQKRGYSSHNGVVMAISLDTKKCLDVEVLSDKCQQCLKWSKKQNDPKYEEWKANHQCKINHTGSSGSMETAGALTIFERSCATKGLKYKDMLGDSDSSTYSAILESKPYGEDCIPSKLECIGHVQKRVGSRLRRLKSSNKGRKLSDGKGISGKGRLTTGKMDVLQNYYGLAIRENLDNVEEMAKAVKASLFHVASTEENPQHHLCPKGENSWCGYQRDSKTYKHKNGIPKPIVELVEPIFDDLADPALLKKCTHGLTQNPNECLNGIIWDRCPKTTYVEQETVALATYLAVLKFNDGDISYLKILEGLDITPGFFTCKGAKDCDRAGIKLSARKSSEKVKSRRKSLRHFRKKFLDNAEDKEGVTYEAGSF